VREETRRTDSVGSNDRAKERREAHGPVCDRWDDVGEEDTGELRRKDEESKGEKSHGWRES